MNICGAGYRMGGCSLHSFTGERWQGKSGESYYKKCFFRHRDDPRTSFSYTNRGKYYWTGYGTICYSLRNICTDIASEWETPLTQRWILLSEWSTFRVFFFFLIMFDLIPVAHSAVTETLSLNENYSLQDIIRVGISLVVLIAWLCAVVFILWWWVMLVLSGGKDDKVKPAINSIRYAVIWVIIILISILILPRFGDTLWLHVSDYLSPTAIFNTVRDLSNKIFWWGTSSISSDFSNL